MFSSFLSTMDTSFKVAIYERFKDIFSFTSVNTGVLQFPRDVAYRKIAEKTGELALDFINVWKTNLKYSWDKQRTSLARRGISIPATSVSPTLTNIKAVPVDIEYEISFWSKNLDRINQAIESYFLWQHDNPTLSILYNDLFPIDPKLHFAGDVQDHSTVPIMFDKGTIFTYSCSARLDGWILQSDGDEDVSAIHKIQVTYRDNTNLTDAEIDTIIVEDSSYDEDLDSLVKLLRTNLYQILNVDVANRYFYVKENVESDFTIGKKIFVGASTGNDNAYTIENIIVGSDNVILQVVESISDSTVDGTISFNEN